MVCHLENQVVNTFSNFPLIWRNQNAEWHKRYNVGKWLYVWRFLLIQLKYLVALFHWDIFIFYVVKTRKEGHLGNQYKSSYKPKHLNMDIAPLKSWDGFGMLQWHIFLCFLETLCVIVRIAFLLFALSSAVCLALPNIGSHRLLIERSHYFLVPKC